MIEAFYWLAGIIIVGMILASIDSNAQKAIRQIAEMPEPQLRLMASIATSLRRLEALLVAFAMFALAALVRLHS